MLRLLEERDISIIIDMDRECFPPNQQLDESEYREALMNGKGWVYETLHNKTIVGFLVATMEGMPYVFSVAVKPEHRGKFIATRLMHMFLKEYDKYPFVHLHTDNENPAQTLYFKLGFRIVDLEEDYYGDQTVGLHMVRYKIQ
jgi:ribosomal protein S18 acetylase RimI-like enzyme